MGAGLSDCFMHLCKRKNIVRVILIMSITDNGSAAVIPEYHRITVCRCCFYAPAQEIPESGGICHTDFRCRSHILRMLQLSVFDQKALDLCCIDFFPMPLFSASRLERDAYISIRPGFQYFRKIGACRSVYGFEIRADHVHQQRKACFGRRLYIRGGLFCPLRGPGR